MLADGAKIAVDLADEIDVQAGRQQAALSTSLFSFPKLHTDQVSGSCHMCQVSIVDIGGGLPVNFEDARTSPNFFHYAQVIVYLTQDFPQKR